MRKSLFTGLLIAVFLTPTISSAEVPSFAHLRPAAYMAPMIPGYYQLTWVGQYQTPPRPEFTNIPLPEITNPNINWGVSVFPKCDASIQVRCIQDVEYKTENDTLWSKAMFAHYLAVTTPAFSDPHNRDRYLKWATEGIDVLKTSKTPIDSARSSLWELQISGERQLFMATVAIQYDFGSKWFSGFKLNLMPIKEIFVKNEAEYTGMNPEKTWCARTGYPDSFFMNNNFHPLTSSKPASDIYDYCLVKENFPSGWLFRISTQLSPKFEEGDLANWVTSRTTQTRAYTITPGGTKPTVAIFEGMPAKIQAGVTQVPHTQAGFESWYEGSSFKKLVAAGQVSLQELKQNFAIDNPSASGGESHYGEGWESINQWKSTEKYLDPALTIEQEMWHFSVITLESDGDAWINKCDSVRKNLPGFSGVISTNATVFVQGPPKLETSGDLDFQIAGTHLKENGEKNTGTYHLSIADPLAKCIWGVSEFGAGASISVITEDGVAQIATTAIGKSNGQINFEAAGFHFSTNLIKVNIGEIKKSSAGAIAGTKVTLICIKGKVSKKISGANPKCPAGYKKK